MTASRALFKTCGVEIELFPSDDPEEVIITFDTQVGEEFTVMQRDVTLIVGNSKLTAHKDVLISRIPYFPALFSSRMTESVSAEVNLSQFDFGTVISLVNAAYTGQITITDETMLDVMIGAHYLQMDSILDACAKYLEANPRSTLIRRSNALSLFVFCRDVEYRKLDHVLLTFMDMNFISLSHTSEFSEMSVDYLIDYVGRDSLYVDNEMQVFEAISKWIRADDSRKEQAARLLECVRCHLIPEKLISEVVENTNWVRGNRRCKQLVNEALHIIRSNVQISNISFKNYERFSRSLIFVMGGERNIISFYDPKADQWTACKKLPREREYCEIAIVDKKIYSIRGYDGNSFSSYDVFDTEENKWEMRYVAMRTDRTHPVVGTINGKIYVTGGFRSLGSAASLEMMDPAAKPPVWVMLARMSKPRKSPASCVADGKFYVIGGRDDSCGQNLDDGECYDPKTNCWSSIASMNKKKDGCGAAVLKGQIYVVGGEDGWTFFNDLERYDPAKNTWTTLKGMNAKRSCAGVAVSCGKLYVFGGFDVSRSHRTMEVYDPETDCWQESLMQNHSGSITVATMPIPASLQSPA